MCGHAACPCSPCTPLPTPSYQDRPHKAGSADGARSIGAALQAVEVNALQAGLDQDPPAWRPFDRGVHAAAPDGGGALRQTCRNAPLTHCIYAHSLRHAAKAVHWPLTNRTYVAAYE